MVVLLLWVCWGNPVWLIDPEGKATIQFGVAVWEATTKVRAGASFVYGVYAGYQFTADASLASNGGDPSGMLGRGVQMVGAGYVAGILGSKPHAFMGMAVGVGLYALIGDAQASEGIPPCP